MNLTDSNKPFVVNISGEMVSIPRFKRADWKQWGAEKDAERTEKATAGMTKEERFRHLSFYVIPETTSRELRQCVLTLPGQEKVISVCLKKLGWDDDRIAKVLEENSSNDIELLAFALASNHLTDAPAKPPANNQEGEQGADFRPPARSDSPTG